MGLRGFAALLLTFGTCACAQRYVAPVAEAGVSRGLAESRSARISEVRYALNFALVAKSNSVAGGETLTFRDGGAGDLALDYRDGVVASMTVNGTGASTLVEDGHLRLPGTLLRRGANTVELKFTSGAAPAGKAFTRYADRDDGSEYVYTLFVPMDASMAFPCFDQPDLKARFTLRVRHPAEWQAISNSAVEFVARPGTSSETDFQETLPISTYLFAFAAGPWQKIEGGAGEPTLYVRKSQLARAKTEAPQVQQMAGRGVRWFSDYFARAFPFPKYELVLIPGFPFGGDGACGGHISE